MPYQTKKLKQDLEYIFPGLDTVSSSYIKVQVLGYFRGIMQLVDDNLPSDVRIDLLKKIRDMSDKYVTEEFGDQERYFSAILNGRDDTDRMGEAGSKQLQSIDFFMKAYWIQKSRHKRNSQALIYTLMYVIYYYDCGLAMMKLRVKHTTPEFNHKVRRLLLFWTFVKEQLLLKKAGEYLISSTQRRLAALPSDDVIDEEKKWKIKINGKIESKEKKQIGVILDNWVHDGHCAYFLPIAESSQKRFDGILIILPIIDTNSYEALTSEGQEAFGQALKSRKKMIGSTFNRMNLAYTLKGESDNISRLKNISTKDKWMVWGLAFLSDVRVNVGLMSKFMGNKKEIFNETPLDHVGSLPTELKEATSNTESGISKLVKKAIKQMIACEIPSGSGSIALQLTHSGQTKDIVTAAVARAFSLPMQ
jgi:hypothetical protein